MLTTPGGWLLVVAVLGPFVGVLVGLVLGGGRAQWLASLTLLIGLAIALATGSMFMAAGLIYTALGHDRIADLAGVARVIPVTVLTFLLAGIALMGVVPSGAYLAKKLLLDAAEDCGQWRWTIIVQGGAQ